MSAYRLTSDLAPRAQVGPLRATIGHSPGAVVVLPAMAGATSSRVDRQECAAQIVPLLVPPRVVKSKSGILVDEAPSEATLIHVKLDPDERLSMLIVGSIKASV